MNPTKLATRLTAALALLAAACAGNRADIPQPVMLAGENTMALQVDCQPEQAEVEIDGVLQGSCASLNGKRIRLPAGSHRLQVRAPGFRPFTSQVDARGMLQRLTVTLQRYQPL
ncbi:MAG: hypothetical protein DRI34_01250 [Deltaproteobacteria bacterium]|nr:MAG: hypothetical protein DRI34_01250 [Deltaproteobacteria bacterium]